MVYIASIYIIQIMIMKTVILNEENTLSLFTTLENKIIPSVNTSKLLLSATYKKEILTDKRTIRNNLYNFYDEYIAIYDDKEVICDLIGISLSLDTSSVADINFMYFETAKLNDFIIYLKQIAKIAIKPLRKYRVYLSTEDSYYSYWKNELEDNGFVLEVKQTKMKLERFTLTID